MKIAARRPPPERQRRRQRRCISDREGDVIVSRDHTRARARSALLVHVLARVRARARVVRALRAAADKQAGGAPTSRVA